MEPLAWLKAHSTDIKEFWVPLITACISFLSVTIALLALLFARRDRREANATRESERQADAAARETERNVRLADARRREQEALLGALQGEKESVGFMALEVARQPSLVTDDNRERLFSALCTAWVFESSSRARAFILRALKQFYSGEHRGFVRDLLKEIRSDLEVYDNTFQKKELGDRIARLDALILALEESAQQGAAADAAERRG